MKEEEQLIFWLNTAVLDPCLAVDPFENVGPLRVRCFDTDPMSRSLAAPAH
jgi:hypothetical protein